MPYFGFLNSSTSLERPALSCIGNAVHLAVQGLAISAIGGSFQRPVRDRAVDGMHESRVCLVIFDSDAIGPYFQNGRGQDIQKISVDTVMY